MTGGLQAACRVACLFTLPWLTAGPVHAEDVPEPAAYRLTDFRAPVPQTVLGVPGLTDEEARAAWDDGAVFIDVFPRPPKPANLPEGTLWMSPKRTTIKGAYWLPNVGYGKLDETRSSYFAAMLEELTGGDKTRAIVMFCLADCWMSWNAARRATLELGYEAVRWYPDGTDGWDMSDWPMQTVEGAELGDAGG